MKYKLQSYNLQELGQRRNQEDSLFPAIGMQTPDSRLFILCDGMGGHEKGEVASQTVCDVMSRSILSHWNPDEPLSDELLQQTIDDAYDALDAKDDGADRKMGTTMTLVCFHCNGVTVAHIGDSRVYQLRPADDSAPARIMFRTQDHSLVNDLIKIGEITEEEAKTHPQRNVITRAMQPCQQYRAKADVVHLTDVQAGDYFYMCSDGMLEQTTDENLRFIITMHDTTDEQKIEMLRQVTLENKDNHTAHLIHVEEVTGAIISEEAKDENGYSEPKGVLVTPTYEQPEATVGKTKKKISFGMLLAVLARIKSKLGRKMIVIALAVIAILVVIAFVSCPKGENTKVMKKEAPTKVVHKKIKK